ncbi:MAG: NAD(P)-binding protein [Nitrospina sp.]|nr:NAD(P)-binding protein [Nitrospina sp.]
MKIAIIGTGISGLTSAYLLSKEHSVHVYEAKDYIGGHVYTLPVHLNGTSYEIDTGFIVFNDRTYPNFNKLLNQINVLSQPTSMSFSVKCETTGLEYNGTSINGLFAQRLNLLKPSFLLMVKDILRFNRDAKIFLNDSVEEITFGEFLKRGGYSNSLKNNYALPMASAIWSAKSKVIENANFRFFAQFFDNHGMLNVNDRPQWRVIKGGSKQYILKLIESFKNNIRINSPVDKIIRKNEGIEVVFNKQQKELYDRVIIGTHSDQALKMIENPSHEEREILSAIPYQTNVAHMHWDCSVLPKQKNAWASWNYFKPNKLKDETTVTYYMNMLQSLNIPRNICVSLNMEEHINPKKIYKKIIYQHPVFTSQAILAQKRHKEIDGVDKIHFCGAYWGSGFHEDGINSALSVCKAFGRSL